MEPKALVYQNWDELVFENRNKLYGAYVLRKSYHDKVLLGLGVSVVILVLLLFVSQQNEKPFITTPVEYIGRTIEVLPSPPLKQKKVEAKPPISKPKTNIKKDVVPLITKAPTDEPPQDQPAPEPVFDDPGTTVNGNNSIVSTSGVDIPVVKEETVFVIVETPPVYEGGLESMARFFQSKLKYPNAPKKLGIEGTVFVSFVVNGDGTVRDVTVVRGIHPDCDKEAVRVVSMLPGWVGGKQGGVPVAVRMMLPIKFKLN